MKKTISALVVGAPDESKTIERALNDQSVRARRAGTCREAQKYLKKAKPPDLLFTETNLPDGTWADMIKLAGEAREPVDVIVISRLDDVGLYLQTIEEGAFDFISAPLPGSDFAHVVKCASNDVGKRRQTAAKSRPAA